MNFRWKFFSRRRYSSRELYTLLELFTKRTIVTLYGPTKLRQASPSNPHKPSYQTPMLLNLQQSMSINKKVQQREKYEIVKLTRYVLEDQRVSLGSTQNRRASGTEERCSVADRATAQYDRIAISLSRSGRAKRQSNGDCEPGGKRYEERGVWNEPKTSYLAQGRVSSSLVKSNRSRRCTDNGGGPAGRRYGERFGTVPSSNQRPR